jgi:hypothetical protein
MYPDIVELKVIDLLSKINIRFVLKNYVLLSIIEFQMAMYNIASLKSE